MILSQKEPKKDILWVFCLKFRTSIFCFILSVFFLWFVPPSWAQGPKKLISVQLTAHERDWLSKHNVILIAPDPYFPPIEWIDNNGEYRGIAAEFMQLVKNKTGINFKVVKCKNWDEVLEKAKSRQVDAIPAAAQTPERSKYLTYSEAHIVLPGVIITGTKVTGHITLQDLSAMRVSVVKAYVWQEFLETDFPRIKLDLVHDLQEGLNRVALGISDALVATLPVALYYIEKKGITNLRVAGETGYYTRLSFASRKDWPELNAIVKKALAQIPQSKKEEILGKWIGLEEKSLFKRKEFWITILVVVGTCGLFIFGISLWNRSLRRLVNQRTEGLEKGLTQREQAEEALRESEEKLRVQNKIAGIFLTKTDEEMYGEILNVVLNVMESKFGVFGYINEQGAFVCPSMTRDIWDQCQLPDKYIVFPENTWGNSIWGNGLRTRKSAYSNNPFNVPEGHIPIDKCLTVPLVYQDKSIGSITVANKRTDYTESDKQTLEVIAEHVAPVLHAKLERKRSEEALRESEERYRIFVETMTDAVFTLDTNGKFTYLNLECEKLTGYHTHDLIGRPFTEILEPEYIESTVDRFKRGLSGETIPIYEVELRHKEGQKLPVELKVTPLLGADGMTRGRIGVARDLRARKQAEKALREGERKFRSLFDFSPQAIALTDVVSGQLVDVNDMFCELTKYTKEEILGHTTTEMGFYSEEDRNRFATELRASGEVHGLEMDFKIKDGSILNSLMFSRIVQIAGKPSIVTIFLNVTEQKRLEAQFEQAQKMEAVGTLAGGIAHDFNNLLMGIQGNASLILLDKDSGHPDYEKLKNIEQYVQNGADLTKQLLGFAKRGKYEAKPTDLNNLIKKNIGLFGRTKKEISIHPKYQEDIWTVEVDKGQIEQILMNLYVNAWQAMPGGGDLYIETENVTLDESYIKPYNVIPGNYVKISVTDTGVGMDEKTRQRIFEPFFTSKEMGRGTGLGLASAYGIIKNHGGIINVYSEKGKGASFSIYLPASEKEVVKEKESSEELLKGTETVLLVDDEDMIIDVGKKLLETLGYNVLIARGGREAIEIYNKNKGSVDMVILDMIMPHMSGGETYDHLKQTNPHIKVLLSSGYTINGQASEILDRGCNGFIQKPFNRKALSHKIREILD